MQLAAALVHEPELLILDEPYERVVLLMGAPLKIRDALRLAR